MPEVWYPTAPAMNTHVGEQAVLMSKHAQRKETFGAGTV